MRDGPEHDDGGDRNLPHAKSRGLCFARKRAPGRRNRVLRTGEIRRKIPLFSPRPAWRFRYHLFLYALSCPFSFSFSMETYPNVSAGPPPSTHSAPHVRTTDLPASLVRRLAPAFHLRARPRPSPTEPGPAPAAVPARVGRDDTDAAREPGDTRGRRALAG